MKRYIPIEHDSSDLPLKKQGIQAYGAKIANYYNKKEAFYCIERDALFPDSEVFFSLYAKNDFDYNQILEASESSPIRLTNENLNIEGDIAIKINDLHLYDEYVKSLEKKLKASEFDDKKQAIILKEKTKLLVKNILSHPKSGENIKEASTAVEQIINSILSNNNFLHEFISLKNHDYYTYIHCVNVAVLSIGLGKFIALLESEIFNLGMGALLHDIGKIAISPNILNKPGRLTSVEYKIMQNHVMEGVKILEENPDFPKPSLTAVAQHHERLSGNGYPLKLSGAIITKYAKIIAISDTYDSLTTERPNKLPLIPFEALSIIVNECEHYDSEYLSSFIKLLGRLDE